MWHAGTHLCYSIAPTMTVSSEASSPFTHETTSPFEYYVVMSNGQPQTS
jgi:hypothetical protein